MLPVVLLLCYKQLVLGFSSNTIVIVIMTLSDVIPTKIGTGILPVTVGVSSRE